jgi:NhaP-type Na+/H+ and K+/H+ antiporter
LLWRRVRMGSVRPCVRWSEVSAAYVGLAVASPVYAALTHTPTMSSSCLRSWLVSWVGLTFIRHSGSSPVIVNWAPPVAGNENCMSLICATIIFIHVPAP